MQIPHDCSPPLNHNGESERFQSGNTGEATPSTSDARPRAKQLNKEKRKIRDKKYRLKKKREMEASEHLNMLLIVILKALLRYCPTSLMTVLSMFFNEEAFCPNISGEVSNQLPQQNGNQMQVDQMQNLAGVGGGGAGIPLSGSPASIFAMDHELQRPRLNMHEIEIILQLLSQPVVNEAHQKKKLKEIYKRIGEGLFKSTQTNDEYINQNTLEIRLSNLIEQLIVKSHNQRHVQLSAGTMMPTPWMSHSGNSNMMASSVDTTMIYSAGNGSMAPTVNAGTILPTGGIHGIQRMTSEMIPTLGFNDNNNSHSYMNIESSNNGTGGHSSFESMVVSQLGQQNQFVGSQKNLILHTLGSQMSNNLTSTMQQRPYGFTNGATGDDCEQYATFNEAGVVCESNMMNEVSAETANYQEYDELISAHPSSIFQ